MNGYANNPEWSVCKEFLWDPNMNKCDLEYAADGSCTYKLLSNASGENVYRYTDVGGGMYLEVSFSNCVYGENSKWQYDYEAMFFGEHRVGAEGFVGDRDNAVCDLNEYRLDSGEYEREDWLSENEYFYVRYDGDGKFHALRYLSDDRERGAKMDSGRRYADIA